MSRRRQTRGERRQAERTRSQGISRPLWAAAAVSFVVVIGAMFIASSGGDDGSEATATGSGVLAPDLALPNFDGQTVRLADFRGEGLVVNFWASWCPPCRAEMPGFEQVYQRYRGTGVAFLGINLTDDPVSALRVVEETGVTYPLAQDADGTAFAAFGGFGMPTTVFISSDGEILERYTGLLTASQLEQRIESHFEIGLT